MFKYHLPCFLFEEIEAQGFKKPHSSPVVLNGVGGGPLGTGLDHCNQCAQLTAQGCLGVVAFSSFEPQ